MINLTFTVEQLNIVLRHLDAGSHGQVRQLIDYILTEAQKQQQSQPMEVAPAATSAETVQ